MAQARRNLGVLNVVYTLPSNQARHYVLLGFNKKKQAWEVPGGKAEDNESMLQAVIRETEEETGRQTLGVQPVAYVDTLDDYLVLTFRSLLELTDEELYGPQANPEADKYDEWRWFSLSELPKLTWLSAEIIRQTFGVVVSSEGKLPCPFKKKVKSK